MRLPSAVSVDDECSRHRKRAVQQLMLGELGRVGGGGSEQGSLQTRFVCSWFIEVVETLADVLPDARQRPLEALGWEEAPTAAELQRVQRVVGGTAEPCARP